MAYDSNGNELLSLKGKYFFVLFYALAIVSLFLIFQPYLIFMILGAIIVIFLFPVNLWMRERVQKKVISSLIMTLLVLVLILVPTFFITQSLANESRNVYESIKSIDMQVVSAWLTDVTGITISVDKFIVPLTESLKDYMTNSFIIILKSIPDFAIKLFIMFFLIYYGFKEGELIKDSLLSMLPITRSHKNQLRAETKKILYGVMYAQALVALIQGFFGGLFFWIFGVQNPILWGAVMAVFAFIPFLGTPIVWVPAILFEIAAGDYFVAIGLLITCGGIVMNIDNVLKPKLLGDSTGLHPLLALVGIFGGMALFGIVGLVIGPIIVGLSVLIIKFFNKDVHFARN